MRFLTLVVAALISTAAFASTETESATSLTSGPAVAELNSGRVALSASGFGIGFGSGTGMFAAASPRAEYFVANNISLGLTTSMGWASGSSSPMAFSAGPAATFYFFNQGRTSAYGGLNYTFNNLFSGSGSTSQTLTAEIGANIMPASWIGVGPKLSVFTTMGSGTVAAAVNVLNLYFYL